LWLAAVVAVMAEVRVKEDKAAVAAAVLVAF
jgi:hypothetical protein